MRISLFLNSTLSKSCVQYQKKDWCHEDQKLQPSYVNKRSFRYEATSSKQHRVYSSVSNPVNRIREFPAFLNASNEIQWFISSRETLTHLFDNAVKQLYSLSSLLLLWFTLMMLSAQVVVLGLLLASSTSLPLGFQFMIASVFLISTTAFKIMN